MDNYPRFPEPYLVRTFIQSLLEPCRLIERLYKSRHKSAELSRFVLYRIERSSVNIAFLSTDSYTNEHEYQGRGQTSRGRDLRLRSPTRRHQHQQHRGYCFYPTTTSTDIDRYRQISTSSLTSRYINRYYSILDDTPVVDNDLRYLVYDYVIGLRTRYRSWPSDPTLNTCQVTSSRWRPSAVHILG